MVGMVKTMGKKINIRPTSSVYATYKRLSYQPWTAIAEFVDNSTQSFYDHKSELMSLKYAKATASRPEPLKSHQPHCRRHT